MRKSPNISMFMNDIQSYNFDPNKRYIMFHESASSGVVVFRSGADCGIVLLFSHSDSAYFGRGLWELFIKNRLVFKSDDQNCY